MSELGLVPYEREAQRRAAQLWAAVVAGRPGTARARPTVHDSWQRSLRAAVSTDLPRAPIALAGDALGEEAERADWLPLAHRASERLQGAFASGHILGLFDAAGRMLACRGDPAVLDGLGAINFRPGGLWAESAVGTNGPGTALAVGRPVHIVGPEHFCQELHAWHCAAVPVRDPATGEILGALDLSGFRERAHPHTLELAVALAAAVEQMLRARETERRYAVLHRFAELAATCGGDALVAVDRAGRVLHATPATPDGLRPGTATPDRLRAAMAAHVRDADDADAREVLLALHDDVGLTAVSHPVLDGRTPVGACLVLAGAGGGAASRRAAPPASAPSPAARATTRYGVADIVGRSAALAAARRVAGAAASNALPVLLLGESGTGKEVFAQAIHQASVRRHRPFVAVNCAALPRELVESELFGYVGGAFSGARREGSPGRFVTAHGGTIFLDEVGELPPTAQAALLRVLQEGEVTAVGGAHPRAVDVRVIAATNRDLRSALASGALRTDLYYRLEVLSIELPPLRARHGDVPLLARHFLAAAGAEVGRRDVTFGPGVLDALEAHHWPGNVRELRNLVRRLVALCVGSEITVADLPWSTAAPPVAPTSAVAAAVDDAPTDDPERARTLHVLATARSMREAALRLGITRSTLYRRLDRYGVRPERMLSAR